MKKIISAGFLGIAALCFCQSNLLCQEPISLTGQVNLETPCLGGYLITVTLYLFRGRTPVEDAAVRLDETFVVSYVGSGGYFLSTAYSNPNPDKPFSITIEAPGLAQPIIITGDFAASLTLKTPKRDAVVDVSKGIPFIACWTLAKSAGSVRAVIQKLDEAGGAVSVYDQIVPGSCLSLPSRGLLPPQKMFRLNIYKDLDSCSLGGDYFPGSEVTLSVSASCLFRTL
jgi:hypothetical protein